MTESEIQKSNPKFTLVEFSKKNNNSITKAIAKIGDSFYIVEFSTSNGRVSRIIGTKTGRPFRKKPKLD